MTFRVSSYCCVDSSDLRIFSDGEEECQYIDLVLESSSSWYTIEDVLNQLQLLLTDIDLVSLSKFGQLSHPSLFFLFHKRLHIILTFALLILLHCGLG